MNGITATGLNAIPEEMESEREELKVVPAPSPYQRLRRASHHVISVGARPARARARTSSEEPQHDTESFSLLYCSLFMFLLVSFVLGLILVGVGMVSFPHCKVKYPSRGDSQGVRTGQSLASVAQYPGTHRLFSLPHPLLWRD